MGSPAASENATLGGDSAGVSSSELRPGTVGSSAEERRNPDGRSGQPAPGAQASESGSSAAARANLDMESDGVLYAQVMRDIDLATEVWDTYNRMVYKALGALESRNVPVSIKDVERALMRNRYIADVPPVRAGSNVARVTYFRAKLQEAMTAQTVSGQGTRPSADSRVRLDVLLELSRT